VKRRLVLAVVLLLFAPVRAARTQGPSPVLVPPQKVPLRFSHVQHLTAAGLTCTFCHNKIARSTKTEDRNIPGHPECDECHDRTAKEPAKAKPAAACETCHVGYSSVRKDVALTADMPQAYIKFPHKNHLDRKINCATCHGDYVKEKVALATRDHLPTMTLCLTCHDNRQAPFACRTCHLTDRSGMVRTEYPTGVLKPAGIFRNDRHDAAWLQNHRVSSANDKAYCMNCHTEQYCVDCHNGAMKPLKIHPGDFVSMHPIFAKSAAQSCDSCHRDQSFCLSCHQRLGVSHVTGFAREGLVGSPRGGVALRFHPEGWVSRAGAQNQNQHGFHAQRNIRQCTPCHSERTCTESCHRSNLLPNARGIPGQGFPPHGPTLDWLARCGALFARNRRVCYKCHVATDANHQLCR
jgi:hypothetical protein